LEYNRFMITPKTALIFIVIALVLGLGMYVMYPTPQKYDAPKTKTATSTQENTANFPAGAQMEDGTLQ
jgi:hypothetical protein